ncbi:MAG: ABC transporter permease [Chromatiales bacterium]|jgi:ABC-2 type transport system permease protein|nr:ABC transporter permease [Chromatiales bacterium]
MRVAVFKTMWWTLLRDRGALLMGFVLPPIVFVIFATIFSGTAGGDLVIKVAIFDERESDSSTRLLTTLRKLDNVRPTYMAPRSREQVTLLVRDGDADVGIVVRANGTNFGKLEEGLEPPLLIVAEPTREIAVAALLGSLQSAYFTALPDAVVGGVAEIIHQRLVKFTGRQRRELQQGLKTIATLSRQGSIEPFGQMFDRENVHQVKAASTDVTYYAGAVAILFLLFSASSAAMTLIEERDSGLLQRLALGPGGVYVVVDGKFAFIALQGFAQVCAIFAVAWSVFGVAVPQHFMPWLATSILAAFSASGLALAFVSVCRTRQQAHSLGNFIILIMAAVGGSMVPRFLMPEFIRDVGWLTPNTWVLEAYAVTFWRPVSEQLLVPFTALFVSGLAGLSIARWATRRAVRGDSQ